jgi:hypothetical protein
MVPLENRDTSGCLYNERVIHAIKSQESNTDPPDRTDIPAPERIMTFFAEARAFLNASLSDDGGMK